MDFAFFFRLRFFYSYISRKNTGHIPSGLLLRVLDTVHNSHPQAGETAPRTGRLPIVYSLGEDNLEITSDGLVFHWVNFSNNPL